MKTTAQAPDPCASIGVFDSGLGGLSVLRLFPEILPREHFIYVADTARAPYGHRAVTTIREYSLELARYLIEQRACKALVVACNTATAAAVRQLRERYPQIPIVGMEPAVKPAALATRSGCIGVMATAATIGSDKYAQLLAAYGHKVRVLEDPCEGLVACIEQPARKRGELDTILHRILDPMLRQGVDTLVLGCTHFPLVAAEIQSVAGPDVQLINPAPAVALHLRKRLAGMQAPASCSAQPYELWTSGDPTVLQAFAQRILSVPFTTSRLCDYSSSPATLRNGI